MGTGRLSCKRPSYLCPGSGTADAVRSVLVTLVPADNRLQLRLFGPIHVVHALTSGARKVTAVTSWGLSPASKGPRRQGSRSFAIGTGLRARDGPPQRSVVPVLPERLHTELVAGSTRLHVTPGRPKQQLPLPSNSGSAGGRETTAASRALGAGGKAPPLSGVHLNPRARKV